MLVSSDDRHGNDTANGVVIMVLSMDSIASSQPPVSMNQVIPRSRGLDTGLQQTQKPTLSPVHLSWLNITVDNRTELRITFPSCYSISSRLIINAGSNTERAVILSLQSIVISSYTQARLQGCRMKSLHFNTI